MKDKGESMKFVRNKYLKSNVRFLFYSLSFIRIILFFFCFVMYTYIRICIHVYIIDDDTSKVPRFGVTIVRKKKKDIYIYRFINVPWTKSHRKRIKSHFGDTEMLLSYRDLCSRITIQKFLFTIILMLYFLIKLYNKTLFYDLKRRIIIELIIRVFLFLFSPIIYSETRWNFADYFIIIFYKRDIDK